MSYELSIRATEPTLWESCLGTERRHSTLYEKPELGYGQEGEIPRTQLEPPSAYFSHGGAPTCCLQLEPHVAAWSRTLQFCYGGLASEPPAVGAPTVGEAYRFRPLLLSLYVRLRR